MKLSNACIERPVFAIVLNLILVMLGFSCYFYLDVRFFPKFEPKSITVTANFPGASPALVETALTNPLESALSAVSGIDTMTSQSNRGFSSIKLKLQPNANIDEVANQVRNELPSAQSNLPESIEPPTVDVGWNENEFMEIAFTDPNKTPEEIRDYLDRYINNTFLQVPGLANILTEGADPFAVRIELDPEALAARRLSVNTIQTALQNNNIEMPAGRIKSNNLTFPVTAKTAFKNLDDFRNLVLSNTNNQVIRLKDVATVELGRASDNQSLLLFNGTPAVELDLYTDDDASPITVSKAIQPTLKLIQANLPAGMRMIPYYDNSIFIKDSIHEVYFSIAFAIVCVLIAVFLFLGNWRAISIPIATIPVCLISSFAIMFFMGFTINVITLLALVLSIGLVVDDAIVMLENIHRYLEKGMSALEAAFIGSKQIAFAVIGMTISLAAVYAPVGLLHTRIASIFSEFAYTLAGAVLISGFVALTLSPMMCSRLLREKDLHGPYVDWLEHFFENLRQRYRTSLQYCLEKRAFVAGGILLLALLGCFVFKALPSQFVPAEDMGNVVAVLNAPTGASFSYIKHQALMAEHAIAQNPNIESMGTMISDAPDSFNGIFMMLKPFSKRSQSAKAITEDLNTKFSKIPGLDAFIFAPTPFSGSSHQDLQFSLMTSGSYESLYYTIEKLKKALAHYPGISNINSNMDFDSQEYNITVNTDLASSLGITTKDVDNTLSILLGGMKATVFNNNNYSYDVMLQAQEKDLHSLEDINKFYLIGTNNTLVPLGNLITATPTLAEQTLPHFNRLRSADINAQLGEGYSMGEIMNYLEDTFKTNLPSDTKFAYSGMAKNLQDNNSSMLLVFSLALVFIYLILAALFESFIDPCIVLLTVPICIVGALIALKLLGGSLNIYTDIGLITLIGLVSKHGILITQFINEIRKEGVDFHTAIIEGASIRLRPVLMTTTAMVFGAIPLIFASGASAQSRIQIGIVIISGLLIGTLFSLFVVPIAYSYLSPRKKGV